MPNELLVYIGVEHNKYEKGDLPVCVRTLAPTRRRKALDDFAPHELWPRTKLYKGGATLDMR